MHDLTTTRLIPIIYSKDVMFQCSRIFAFGKKEFCRTPCCVIRVLAFQGFGPSSCAVRDPWLRGGSSPKERKREAKARPKEAMMLKRINKAAVARSRPASLRHCQSSTLLTVSPTKERKGQERDFFYHGVIFDMDGTLTEAHIDFADLRQRTRIPQGDLFTVLEASTPDHIQHAMSVILDIEADAAKHVSTKQGLLQLLEMLKDRQVPVALVTRNTTASVQAFLDLIGPQWAGFFDPILTREFKYVKPDKRLLLHVAAVWGAQPGNLLMVGDSFEDVEVGNAAGTATCLVSGGGNEKPGVVIATPSGALATFTVSGLPQLNEMLQQGSGLRLGWQKAGVAEGLELHGQKGCPAPGLDFLDWCIDQAALRCGGASFPRMGLYAGGLATSDEAGSRVLHVACGQGGLTKMMCSSGMRVLATDTDVAAAQQRGLEAVPLTSSNNQEPGQIVTGSLELARQRGPFETVLLLLDSTDLPGPTGWWQPESVRELLTVLEPTGSLCAEVPLAADTNPAAILNSLRSCGLTVHACQTSHTPFGPRLRIAAKMI